MNLRHGLAAEFSTADALLASAAALHALGYRELETFSSFPVPGTAERLDLRRSRLPRWTLVGGVVGALLGYGIQWYANVWAHPLRVGGRPAHAVPAFVPVTFEATVLGAALATVLGLLFILRLPEIWHPIFEIDGFERASADRFWIAVGADDPLFDRDRTATSLASLDPLRIVAVPESYP